ncbi:MAG TPA: ABC transporter permease subunit [Opitutales bacterium]|nr:ABC transporter permease subunit [Opitutales bacterium]
MLTFILRRALAMIPLLFGISLLVFVLMYLSPGDALTELRARPDVPEELIHQLEHNYGYVNAAGQPNPWYVRYGFWLNTVSPVKFINDQHEFTWRMHWGTPSFGTSIAYQIPVTTLIGQRVQVTLLLAIASLLFEFLLAVPLAVLAAVKKDGWADRLTALFAYGAVSVPEFFLGVLAVYFAAETALFPTGGIAAFDSDFQTPSVRFWDYAAHLILPTIVLGLGGLAYMMRIMRSSMLDYLRAEFVTTARAKGVPEGRVLFLHVLRNAINPLITYLGFAFAGLLSGAVLVENVMNYPGLGRLIFEAFSRHDEYLVMAAVLMGCVMLMLGNLLADLLLAASDPRIRLEKSAPTVATRHRGAAWALLMAAAAGLILIFGACLLPWNNPAQMTLWMNRIKVGGGIALLLAGGTMTWFGWPIFRQLFHRLHRRPITAIAVLCLLFLYGSMLGAPFLATQPIDNINLRQTYHPPTGLHWANGRLCAQLYVDEDPAAAHYVAQPGALLPLKIFGHGFEYSFLGLFKTTRHLLEPDYEALAAQLGHPVNPADYPFYLLGSDPSGRDVFSRLLYGSRISLTIGLVGIGITLTMGFLVGGLAGYFGGSFDFFAMRGVEFLMAIPTLYLLLALRAALADYFEPAEMYLVIIIILSLIGWAGSARVLRGMSLSLRERAFVTAAEAMGQSTGKILFKHFLPNLIGYLLVAATLSIPGYILGEAALSFLGLGIQEPSASWGLMLRQSQQDMKVLMLNFWWMLLPGAAIFVTVVSFNLVGDALRDIVDPKMKTR